MRMIKPVYFLTAWLIINSACIAENSFNKMFGKRSDYSATYMQNDANSDGVIDGYDLAMRCSADKDTKTLQAIYRHDQILVKFAPRLSEKEKNLVVEQLNCRIIDESTVAGSDFQAITVPDNYNVEEFLKIMQKSPKVKIAQYNYICRINREPNDQYFSYQWNFNQVNVPRAWDLTFGGDENVTIAVIDSGVAYENYSSYEKAPDLAGTRFVRGYDFINNDDHANDDEGHGTHVTGTIAQTTDNSIGVSGIAYNCTIMPVKVIGSQGTGTSKALADGIRFAADHGARVINMSLGFPNGYTGGPAVEEAVLYAFNKGVIMVAAAGNEGNDNGYTGGIEYPAAFDQCIAVGATRFDKQLTNYSNYGPRMTCVAPGGKVNFDQNSDGISDGILQQTFVDGDPSKFRYVFYEGTSSASPHVAAAAALFVARRGGGFYEFKQALQETCEDLGNSGFDQFYGYGLLNIEQIVLRGSAWGAN